VIIRTRIHAQVQQWLQNLKLVDPPLEEQNARVRSYHFMVDDFVKLVLAGHGPKNLKLKDTAVPTLQTSEAKEAERR